MKNNPQEKRLSRAKMGSEVNITKVLGGGPLRQRILDMGLTKGTTVTVQKLAPLGDPMEITVRGYQLSLRKAEAECILIA